MKKAATSVLPSTSDVRPLPAWARAETSESSISAGFSAGVALSQVDLRVRGGAEFLGAWRQRMALACTAASGSRRITDEGALRDLLYLRAADADAGPQGRALEGWRLLSRPDAGAAHIMESAVTFFGIPMTEDLNTLLVEVRGRIAGKVDTAPVVFAAAIAIFMLRRMPHLGPLAYWCADVALARALGWANPIALLAAGARTRGASIIQSDMAENDATRAVCVAYAKAGLRACDVYAEIARGASKLAAIAPQLRSKQAAHVLKKLLDDDAVPGSVRIPGMTKRSARRLFDRLVVLKAVRELSGRPTFRIYGI